MKSSAKITLVLHEAVITVNTEEAEYDPDELAIAASQSWICSVCGFRNSISGGTKCTLCGVNRSNTTTPAASIKPSRQGTPAHSTSSSRPESPAASTPADGAFIACPACTYLNHPSMQRCEICDTVLGSHNPKRASTPATTTPSGSTGVSSSTPIFVKLSFRKGGDKSFYTALKGALQAKEWDNERLLNRKSLARDSSNDHTLATYGISKGDSHLNTITDTDIASKMGSYALLMSMPETGRMICKKLW